MSKENWTKGDWKVECGDDPSEWARYFPTVSADGYTVVGTEGMYGDRATDLANAHLIAAAPKLYEALKDAADLIRQLAPGAKPDSVVDKCLSGYGKALAAARGESARKFDSEPGEAWRKGNR